MRWWIKMPHKSHHQSICLTRDVKIDNIYYGSQWFSVPITIVPVTANTLQQFQTYWISMENVTRSSITSRIIFHEKFSDSLLNVYLMCVYNITYTRIYRLMASAKWSGGEPCYKRHHSRVIANFVCVFPLKSGWIKHQPSNPYVKRNVSCDGDFLGILMDK